MALASLKARIERLQAKHKAEDGRVLGVIGYCDSQNWPAWKGEGPFIGVIGGVRFKPGEFEGRCLLQQQSLMADVARYAAQLGEDPQAEAPPAFVGKTKDAVAPWPEDRKRPKFVEVAGKEIEIATFKGMTRT